MPRGDELHFILVCQNPTLVELREKYISPYYTSEPSMIKLLELFNNRGKKLFKLARYVEEGLKLYQTPVVISGTTSVIIVINFGIVINIILL